MIRNVHFTFCPCNGISLQSCKSVATKTEFMKSTQFLALIFVTKDCIVQQHWVIDHIPYKSRPELNAWHIADNIWYTFLNKNHHVFIKIALKFVPTNLINNKSPLIQVLAWCLCGTKPIPGPMMTKFTDMFIHASPCFISVSQTKHQCNEASHITVPNSISQSSIIWWNSKEH